MSKTYKVDVLDSASLCAVFNEKTQIDDSVLFYKTKNRSDSWSLTKAEAIDVLTNKKVIVEANSGMPYLGFFNIGSKYQCNYSHLLFESPSDLEKELYNLLVHSITGAELSVRLRVKNDTHHTLKKIDALTSSKYDKYFPKSIASKEFVEVLLKTPEGSFEAIKTTVGYANTDGILSISIDKSANKFKSGVICTPERELVGEAKIKENNYSELIGEVTIAENLVLSTLRNLQDFLIGISSLQSEQIVGPGGTILNVLKYNKACQVFNTRIQLKPFAIIYCESTEEVRLVYNQARKFNLPIRVRSGGHDHEGECSGTNTILIDLSRMNGVKVDKTTGIATIGPGNRFEKLTTDLAKNGYLLKKDPVMIPHGTCATVGIAGFTFGGGWGPWTRAKGMCCESLVGATIILGNGEVMKLSNQGNEAQKRLLWALKGGGGFSYGIVTELKIQTFPLPKELIRFEVEWNPYHVEAESETLQPIRDKATIQVLTSWENVIKRVATSKEELQRNDQLIGTNLKISGIPGPEKEAEFDEKNVYHNCIMYGYWEGNKDELERFINQSFGDGFTFRVTGYGGAQSHIPYGTQMMSNWDRESLFNVQRLLQNKLRLGLNASEPMPPDYDTPAPHKITSRLADEHGLEAGRKAFLRTLTSPLILKGNRALGLFSYVTLGAIYGKFYAQEQNRNSKNSAFPYKTKLYTIQYQTWWNEGLGQKELEQDNHVLDRTNRALDWMQKCRDADIPNTSGAFISFKDKSIPTSTYFGDSYEELIAIKEELVRDEYNHFRTRKTII